MKWILYLLLATFVYSPGYELQAQSYQDEIKKKKKKKGKKRRKKRRGKRKQRSARKKATKSKNTTGMYADFGLMNLQTKQSVLKLNGSIEDATVDLSGLALRSGVQYSLDFGSFKMPIGGGIFYEGVGGSSEPADVSITAYGLNIMGRGLYAMSDSFLLGGDFEYNMAFGGSYIQTSDDYETTGSISGGGLMGFGLLIQYFTSSSFGISGGVKMMSGSYSIALSELRSSSGTTTLSGSGDGDVSGMFIFGGLVLNF